MITSFLAEIAAAIDISPPAFAYDVISPPALYCADEAPFIFAMITPPADTRRLFIFHASR